MSKLELHQLCAIFRPIDGKEFDELVEDIRENGLRQRIVLYKGKILDGQNRYNACLAAGVVPSTMDYNGDQPAAFVRSQNTHRRHDTAAIRAMQVAAISDWERAYGRGGDRKSDQTVILPFDSVAKRAAESGVSEKTQRNADKVARADPNLARAVAYGKISLPDAVERVNGKPAKALDKSPTTDGDVSLEDGAPDPAELLDDLNTTILKQQIQIDALSKDDQAKELLKQIDMRKDAERELGVKMDMVAARDRDLKSWANWFQKVGKLTKLEKRSDVLVWIQERAK